MNTDTSYTSITARLKQHKRTRDGPSPAGCVDVSQLVPERPLPEWIRNRRVKGTQAGPKLATTVPLTLEGNRGGEAKKLDPSSTTSATMILDLNNMRKDWKSVSTKRMEAVQRARIAQNRQAEPIRGFPGEVRQSSTPADSPVALFAQSCIAGKTRKKFRSPTAAAGLDLADGCSREGKEGGVSPLLMKNTYLTLDQSKLPLEVRFGRSLINVFRNFVIS